MAIASICREEKLASDKVDLFTLDCPSISRIIKQSWNLGSKVYDTSDQVKRKGAENTCERMARI